MKGQLAHLITDEIIEACKDARLVMVYGFAKSGKVILAKTLQERLKRKLYISDDYIPYGYEDALYRMADDVKADILKGQKVIVEGVQTSRLMRLGLQDETFIPQVIIKTVCNWYTIEQCYKDDGEEYKLKHVQTMNSNIEKIYNAFLWDLSMKDVQQPVIFELNTSII